MRFLIQTVCFEKFLWKDFSRITSSLRISSSLDGDARDDMIYNALKAVAESKQSIVHEKDEDLPGMGQYYCVHCE